MMRQHIEERTVELGKYIVEKKCTVREAAKKFGISKSTVHKDVNPKTQKNKLDARKPSRFRSSWKQNGTPYQRR